jgi:hypothetical protein
MSIQIEEEVCCFLYWSPVSDTSTSIHLEDEVRFPYWSLISDTSMSLHLENEVSFLCWSSMS